MQYRFGIIIFLLILYSTGFAQQTWNFPAVDKQSYALYQKQDWKELIRYSQKARKKGIDFFYLQARTGIAWYNLGKYRKASEWFLKAWENDHSFEWLQEYLYYSLVFSGRQLEATKISKNFTRTLKQKTGFEHMKPLHASVEAGVSFNPDFNELSNTNFYTLMGENDNYGEGFFLKNFHFETLNFSHRLSPGFNLNHSFTNIGVTREEQVFWGEQNLFSMKINQKQYFLNPSFLLGQKWHVSPSVSFVWGSYGLVLGDYDPNTFYVKETKYSDFVFTLPVWVNKGNFSPGAEVNFANINERKFTQMSAWVSWYPFSNTNFYLTPRVYLKSENGEMKYNTLGISGGVQLGPVHFYGQYLNGEMENFVESGGYIVANFPGKSDQKISGSLYFPMGKKYQFVLRYINQNVVEKYQFYSDSIKSIDTDYEYNKHTVTAGISWKF